MAKKNKKAADQKLSDSSPNKSTAEVEKNTDKVDSKKANETPKEKTSKNKKGGKVILFMFGGFAAIIVVGVIVALATFFITRQFFLAPCDVVDDNGRYQQCLDDLIECNDLLEGCQAEEPNDDTNLDPTQPVTTYKLGEEGILRLPSSWVLSEVNVSHRYLTDGEKATLGIQGTWPIYESTEYVLSVVVDPLSKMTFKESSLFVPGATGFYPEVITEEYVLISEIQNSRMEYALRIREGNAYKYLLAFERSESEIDAWGEPDAKYSYFPLDHASVRYQGSSEYLEEADEIFLEACFLNSTDLCGGIKAFE